MTWPMPACAGVVVLEGLDGEVEDPDARACLGRSSPQLLNMKNLVLMPVPAGGQQVLHTRARPAPVETAESCGTATSVAAIVLLPCAQPPSSHMGTQPPHTTITRKTRHPNKNQPPPRKVPALPCATPTTTVPARRIMPLRNRTAVYRLGGLVDEFLFSLSNTPYNQPTVRHLDAASDAKSQRRPSPTWGTRRHRPRCTDTPQSRRGVRPISSRNWTDFEAEYDRTRRGTRPNSRRKWTDLDAELDRTRAGDGPISTRNSTELEKYMRYSREIHQPQVC